MNKKGAEGISILIIFIATMIVAVVAAAVFLQWQDRLQTKSYEVVDQGEAEFQNRLEVVRITGIDGTDGKFERFEVLVRMMPGGTPIQLDSIMVKVSTSNVTASLTYLWNATLNNGIGGYSTLGYNESFNQTIQQGVSTFDFSNDIDLDGKVDHIYMGADRRLYLNVSSEIDDYIFPLALNCSWTYNPGVFENMTVYLNNPYIEKIELSKYDSCNIGVFIPNFVNDTSQITLKKATMGNYAVEYIAEDAHMHEVGKMFPSEMLKIYIESPRDIISREDLNFIFLPKSGGAANIRLHTPELISEYEQILYPY